MLNNQAAVPPDVGLLIAFDFSNFFEDFVGIALPGAGASFTQAENRRQDTANATGPINRPIMPKAISPADDP